MNAIIKFIYAIVTTYITALPLPLTQTMEAFNVQFKPNAEIATTYIETVDGVQLKPVDNQQSIDDKLLLATTMNVCKIKLCHGAFVPKRATLGSAGYDLTSPADVVIKPKSSKLIDLQFSLEMPDNVYAKIESRSGLALKHRIIVGAGVIDTDYRGNVGVLLFNFGKQTKVISRGERIAQMIFLEYKVPQFYTITQLNSLSVTERGDGGFGSTGQATILNQVNAKSAGVKSTADNDGTTDNDATEC